jgi:FAD/FMN-containing dehydrogenase
LHRVEKAGWEIMKACVDLGGTISGEHGIGLEKQDAMRMVFNEDDFNVQRGLKIAFDPENILNPGKVLPKPLEAGNGGNSGNRPVVVKSREISSTKGVVDLMGKIKTAAAQKQTVVPAGSGSYSQFGNSTAGDPQALGSSALTDVIEYDSANQVITVGAGMPLKALQAHLQEQNQWLPVRPPFFTDSSTVGRLVALAPCGPERMYYGAPRDLLLGLRFINSSGLDRVTRWRWSSRSFKKSISGLGWSGMTVNCSTKWYSASSIY